jgi:hypothetical protein
VVGARVKRGSVRRPVSQFRFFAFFLCTLSEIFSFCASEHSGILLLLGCITYVLRQVRLLLSYFSLTSLLLLFYFSLSKESTRVLLPFSYLRGLAQLLPHFQTAILFVTTKSAAKY